MSFCEKWSKNRLYRLKLQRIYECASVVGKFCKVRELPARLTINNVIHGTKFYCFDRLFEDTVLYSNSTYRRLLTTNSSCVEYKLNEGTYSIKYSVKYSMSEEVIFIIIHDILSLLFCVQIERNMYITKPADLTEFLWKIMLFRGLHIGMK